MLLQPSLTLLTFLVLFSVTARSNKYSEEANTCTDGKRDGEEKSCQAELPPEESTVTQLQKTIDRLEREVLGLRLQLTSLSHSPRGKAFPEVKFLNYMEKKRILVTGGAGFVGSHLVDRLMAMGHEVIVADNFFTGRKRNIERWIHHDNFELLNHDIVNQLFLEVDEIYHLASPASPPHYMYNAVKTIKTNTVGTVNVLGIAKRVNAKVLIASTSEVYGDPQVHPQDETYWGHVNPIGPRACYDEGKRVAEALAYAYARQSGVEVRVARIFNTYGPRMHMNDGRVVSNFVVQALRGEDITIYGDGSQTRSFQYVTDLVDGLIKLMESNYSQPVNLGNPIERSIQEFAEIIREEVGGSSKIVHLDPVQDDPQKRKPDISRAKQVLNWEPKVKLKDGLRETISFFREEIRKSEESKRDSDSEDEQEKRRGTIKRN